MRWCGRGRPRAVAYRGGGAPDPPAVPHPRAETGLLDVPGLLEDGLRLLLRLGEGLLHRGAAAQGLVQPGSGGVDRAEVLWQWRQLEIVDVLSVHEFRKCR